MGLPNDCPYHIGTKKHGRLNLISDVPGVSVGHKTLASGDINTGVTAIMPHGGNVFRDKVVAASEVINGFGKTTGLLQINELGTLETPIILTNTLSVGTAATGLIRYMLENNPEIGVSTGTVNPVVCECNDGRLNDIRGLHIKEEHIFEAIKNAKAEFSEGAVGAGRGMVCLGLKGGIGSSSRIIEIGNREYTVGALVLSNFGVFGNLLIDGEKIGEKIAEKAEKEQDKGSIIMILATDIPLSARQMKRVCKRAGIGLAKTGSYYGNGSGDIVIGFSTGNTVHHFQKEPFSELKMLGDDFINPVFEAAAESTEEAIISALWHAETTVGRGGKIRKSLKDSI